MNDNKKQLWDRAFDNLNEKSTGEAAETLDKKAQPDTDGNEPIITKSGKSENKRRRFPVLAIVASILVIAGVIAVTGIILANSEFFTRSSESESSTVSEIKGDESSDIQDNINFSPAEDFRYRTNDDGSITIRKYLGTANEVVIPEEIEGKKVTVINSHAFVDCDVTSVIIPDSVTSIGERAFERCSSLKAVTIPDGVTSIGDCTFHSCKRLESVTIGSNVTSIGREVFGNCGSLTAINVDNNNAVYASENGVLFNKDITLLVRYPEGKTDESYDIPGSVTSIGDFAFERCSSLKAVTIPDGVASIGDSAFSLCAALVSVTIPEGVISIAEEAFWYCSSLTSIAIPESVMSIGKEAFHCASLTSVHIPNLFAIVNTSAFDDGVTVTRGSVRSVLILLLCLIALAIVTIIVIRRIRRTRTKHVD